jgi:L-threonylcarbamoyladenylate synthase
VDIILDSGPCPVGIESTILDLSVDPPLILRPGDVTLEDLRKILGEVREAETHSGGDGEECCVGDLGGSMDGAPKAPGMKYRHYAPNAPLTVLDGTPASVAAYVGAMVNGDVPLPGADHCGKTTALLLTDETWKILDSQSNPEATVGKEAASVSRHDIAAGRFFCRKMGSRHRPREMAALLYAALRACDSEGVGHIYVETCSADGQGAAVRNRLAKASGGRWIELPGMQEMTDARNDILTFSDE